MTITQDSSAPLVAVVGATGVQGGSVVKALAESDKQYRIRGFTRDATKAAAEALKKQGVEIVQIDYGGQPSTSREDLASPTRSWAEFAKHADWSKVLM